MKAATFLLAVALAAGTAPASAGIIPADTEGPPDLPAYDVPAGADAAAVLVDVRKYFDEQSYAWALAAAGASAAAKAKAVMNRADISLPPNCGALWCPARTKRRRRFPSLHVNVISNAPSAPPPGAYVFRDGC